LLTIWKKEEEEDGDPGNEVVEVTKACTKNATAKHTRTNDFYLE
jgi:hypothetical protein